MKMNRAEPLRLGVILDMMRQRVANDPETRRQYLCALWPDVVGKHISSYTTRLYMEGRTLHAYIHSASLKEQLGYMRQALILQFNNAAGENAIDNIIFH